MKKTHSLPLLAAIPFLLAAGMAYAKQPNLIIILADDLGYRDVGFNGCKDIPTPHIDSIAANGVRFTSAYVSYSVCSPSRAGLLTGRYQQRFGHERNPAWNPKDVRDGLPLSETTIADTLGKVGYKSGIVGKWHLGAHPDLHPLKRGFDEFYGMLGGGHRYFPEELTLKDTLQAKNEADSYRLWMMRGHEPEKTDEYLTDELSNEAVSFVKRHKETPFFLYLSYNAPHGPLQASEKYLSRFKGIKSPSRRTYAAMVSAVDDGVGRLLEEIRANGMEEDTIIFFLSDNGGPANNGSSNFPLKGFKSSVWEGGFRVPFAMQWKGSIPKGGVFENPVSSLDIFATIAAQADAPTNPDRPLDGVNLVPFLTGKAEGKPHETIYLRKFDGKAFAVRHGEHKLVITPGSNTAGLYDLGNDLRETTDLAEAKPEILADLEKRRAEWNKELIDPVFGPGITEPVNKAKKKPKK
jgi:arylsulfatase A-like enzyme